MSRPDSGADLTGASDILPVPRHILKLHVSVLVVVGKGQVGGDLGCRYSSYKVSVLSVGNQRVWWEKLFLVKLTQILGNGR